MHLTSLTLHEAADLVRGRQVSPVELTRACLDRVTRLGPLLNAFITLTPDLALSQATEAEHAILRGEYRGPLHGIPIALKDLFDTRGVRTTGASSFWADRVPEADSAVAELLSRSGAVCLGKLNMHEWALGVTNVTSHFGATRNPWNRERITGGSSGGSGAAVAAGLCFGALGSDTGGSVRIPAALCGVVGLKPTYGRVSLRGAIPLSWSLDHVGPLARSVTDAALLLQAIAGHDPDDPASVDHPVEDYLEYLVESVEGLRIAIADSPYFTESEAEVQAAVAEAAHVFARLGARVEPVDFPFAREGRAVSRIILHSEAAAFHRERLESAPQSFGADVLPRLREGLTRTAVDYALARHAQVDLRRRAERFFDTFDLLLMPTTPMVAVLSDDEGALQAARAGMSRFTSALNVIGLPAISVPCGFARRNLPIGLQIVARPWAEALLLRAAYAYEQATTWHQHHPAFETGLLRPRPQ